MIDAIIYRTCTYHVYHVSYVEEILGKDHLTPRFEFGTPLPNNFEPSFEQLIELQRSIYNLNLFNVCCLYLYDVIFGGGSLQYLLLSFRRMFPGHLMASLSAASPVAASALTTCCACPSLLTSCSSQAAQQQS